MVHLATSEAGGLPANTRRSGIWMFVRFVLGLAQMGGAIATVVLLLNTGLSKGSLLVFLATSLATVTSRLLFWRKKQPAGPTFTRTAR